MWRYQYTFTGGKDNRRHNSVLSGDHVFPSLPEALEFADSKVARASTRADHRAIRVDSYNWIVIEPNGGMSMHTIFDDEWEAR